MPLPNYYFPQNYQPVSQPVQNNNSSILWVQGESSAKSYPVAPNSSVLLMDSEDSVMYIKSTDQSGMPLPLRIFDYVERKSPNGDSKDTKVSNDFVSRQEFDAFREDITKTIKGIRKPTVEKEAVTDA